MTSLTLVTVAIVVYGVLNRRGYGRALALGAVTPAGAAVVAGGGVEVPTFYAAALGTVVGVLARMLRRDGSSKAVRVPGMVPLVLFVLWSVLVTLSAPMLFDGLALPVGGTLSAGLFSTSNIAQVVYVLIDLSMVAFLARARWAGPEIIGTAVGGVVVLSFWQYLSTVLPLPFPVGLFDNSPGFAFIATAAGGVERVRGILSEPSSLGGICLVAIAYFVARISSVRGPRRAGSVLVAALAVYLGSISTSATFFVAGVALVVVAGVASATRVLVRRGAVSPLTVTVAGGAVLAALYWLPLAAAALEVVIGDKVASTSYDERSGADSAAIRLFLDTGGLGAGLGSNRASSFAASLLSTVGVIGAVLLVVVLATVVRRGYRTPAYRPVVWALAATVLPKIIAGPDLNDASGTMWLCIGLLAHASLREREDRIARRDAMGTPRGKHSIRPAGTTPG